ncbi:hypothetical protein V6N13_034030 [Hibiscus sabdariffa]|uniref:Uncharacterized protein n=1 Tax=Hibiscus sabdariffa TaxID=183260 RepID=A0ABR2F8R5_9ROSI
MIRHFTLSLRKQPPIPASPKLSLTTPSMLNFRASCGGGIQELENVRVMFGIIELNLPGLNMSSLTKILASGHKADTANLNVAKRCLSADHNPLWTL